MQVIRWVFLFYCLLFSSVLFAQSTIVPVPSVSGVLATASNYLANTTSITNQVECVSSNCPAGEYLVMVSISPTTVASVGTITLTLNFTDSSQAQTVTVINLLSLTTKTPGSATYAFYSTGATSITWSTSVLNIVGSYSYDVHVRLMRLT